MTHITSRAHEVATIAVQAERLADLLAANSDMLGDTMQSLKCSEADALTELVALCGYPAAADRLSAAHAAGDEPDDDHYPWVEFVCRADALKVGDRIRDDFGTVDTIATVALGGDEGFEDGGDLVSLTTDGQEISEASFVFRRADPVTTLRHPLNRKA